MENGRPGVDNLDRLRSSVSGVIWPAVPPTGDAAMLLAFQFQFERSQWLAPDELRELQLRQLGLVLRHAYETVPFYRERWRGHYDPAILPTPGVLARLPLLTRADLQSNFETLKSNRIPPQHGGVTESRTSGSTGIPVRVLKTALVQLFWQAIVLREHRWFERDLSGKLASIRHKAERAEGEGWGQATALLVSAGRAATLPINLSTDTQLDWLVEQRPDYLMTYPSNVAELAWRSVERGVRLPHLREVRVFGEAPGDGLRALCRRVWGVPVTDAYSSNEVGYIALQCPEHEHYHVQSESVLVEVLRDDGGVCEPGEIGRVIITDLHNFAMPVVRYEIGDYAEVGPSCPCGRGLAVLKRINGRVRNMLVLPTGERYWPSFGQRSFTDIAPVIQHKFVQRDYSTIEAQLVTARPLTAAEEDGLRRHILSRLPGSFELRFEYFQEIPRSASGKFEDFESEVAASRRA